MTEKEFKDQITNLCNERSKISKNIYDLTWEYIQQLPYKPGSKVKIRGRVGWITKIYPYCFGSYDGGIELRVNWARKDGTRATRENIEGLYREADIELVEDED